METIGSPANNLPMTKAEADPFEAIFRSYWSRIYGILFRIVDDPAEAEDLALETFLRLHERPALLGEGNQLAGWLYRVASNLGYNALRAARRRERYEQRASDPESVNELDPAERADRTIVREQVRTILAEMKPRSARLLILRHSGLSYADLAKTFKLSSGSIGTLLSRAEREFEERYIRRFGNRSD